MRQTASFRFAVVVLLSTMIFIFVSSCTEKIYINNTNPNNFVGGPIDSVIALGEVLYSTDEVDTLTHENEDPLQTTEQEIRPNDTISTIWNCVTTHVDATKFPDEFPLFDPNAELIYPGNLLQGASLEKGTPLPIPLKRGPGTVVMTLINGVPNASIDVDEVNLSNVSTAMNDILAGAPPEFAARFSFSYEKVHSKEQLYFSINAHLKYSGVSTVEGSLSFSRDSDVDYNRYIVKLNQSFYTMALEMPTLGETIFADNVSAEDLGVYVSASNPATYISSVTFGRIFYLLIESTSDNETIEASINASFNAGLFNGDTDDSLKYVSNLENIKIKAFALGGDAGQMIGAITTDFNTMKEFLQSSTILNTGAPISYTLRYLQDPSMLVKLKLATEYDKVDCQPSSENEDFDNIWKYKSSATEYFDLPFYDFDEERLRTSPFVLKLNNLFPNSTTGDAFPKAGPYAGHYNHLNTSNLIAPFPIIFANSTWRFSCNEDNVASFIQYKANPQVVLEGSKFDTTDYTICAVVGTGLNTYPHIAFPNFPNNFLKLENQLTLGFLNDTTIQFIHGNDTLRGTLPFNLLSDATGTTIYDKSTKHLYLFSYRQADSVAQTPATMRIYIDNEEIPLASLEKNIPPLINMTTLSLGSDNSILIPCSFISNDLSSNSVFGFSGGSTFFWEIRAYRQVLTDITREDIQAKLVDEYHIIAVQ